MNKILILSLFFLINSFTVLAQYTTVFISKFELASDSLKEDIGEAVALDFEKIFCTNCREKI